MILGVKNKDGYTGLRCVASESHLHFIRVISTVLGSTPEPLTAVWVLGHGAAAPQGCR